MVRDQTSSTLTLTVTKNTHEARLHLCQEYGVTVKSYNLTITDPSDISSPRCDVESEFFSKTHGVTQVVFVCESEDLEDGMLLDIHVSGKEISESNRRLEYVVDYKTFQSVSNATCNMVIPGVNIKTQVRLSYVC